MDIQRCFEILELGRNASLKEVEQAYRDLVNVWHPDRISHNPRLKHKAEEKLKDVNLAYKTARAYLQSGHDETSSTQPKSESGPAVEAFVEAGTEIALRAGSSLWKTLCRMAGQLNHSNTKGKKRTKTKGG